MEWEKWANLSITMVNGFFAFEGGLSVGGALI